jgi:hypothetical protein
MKRKLAIQDDDDSRKYDHQIKNISLEKQQIIDKIAI